LKPKLVTLDVAGTLVKVTWTPARMGEDCIRRLEMPVDSTICGAHLSYMLGERWEQYKLVNETRNEAFGDEFWAKLLSDWLEQIGQPQTLLPEVRLAVRDVLYGADQRYFALYLDVLPALDDLDMEGVALAAVSNWDYSLHRVLKMLGLYERFHLVVASLEEGFEKPDPRIFELAMGQFDARPEETMHVGDDPTDDLGGAEALGMRALLLDRSLSQPDEKRISSLTQITESAQWTN